MKQNIKDIFVIREGKSWRIALQKSLDGLWYTTDLHGSKTKFPFALIKTSYSFLDSYAIVVGTYMFSIIVHTNEEIVYY